MALDTMSGEVLLSGLAKSVLALRRLADLEIAGRAMMALMVGHMEEVSQLTPPVDYFVRFYTDVAQEFLQFDDEGLVTHHCLRILFYHWQEEMQALRESSLGEALASVGASLPTPSPPVNPDRHGYAGNWYENVQRSLANGRLPVAKQLNPMLAPEECVLKQRRDLMRAALLEWLAETWARQIPATWTLVREAITMRRWVETQPGSRVMKTVEAQAATCRSRCSELQVLYEGWHTLHAGTVALHDPMVQKDLPSVEEFWGRFGSKVADWTIREPLKNEMYVEVACTVAALRGTPLPVAPPPLRYWRRTPWTPSVIRPGVAEMPPFPAITPE